MIPFCWVVFYHYGFYPREGYFLWLFGMLLFGGNEAGQLAGEKST
jgi:hypothetical protein